MINALQAKCPAACGRSVMQLARRPGASTIWAVGQDRTEAEKMPFSNGAIWKVDP